MERKDAEDEIRFIIGRIMTSKRVAEMMKLLASHDECTFRHSLNVAYITGQLCMQMDFKDDETYEITKGALLHDVGKVRVPIEIIQKCGSLSMEEFGLVKTHSIQGYQMLKEKNFSDVVCETALYHHEKRDGSGYPYGLVSEKIPIHAKIVGIVDAYDAMTAERSYKPAYTGDFTLDALKNMQCYSDNLIGLVEAVMAR